MSIFGGVFLAGDDDKEKKIVDHPKKSVPEGIELGEPLDYETYDGGGTITDSFINGQYQYVVVHYNQQAPSDATPYVYLYDELDEEDQTIQDIEEL